MSTVFTTTNIYILFVYDQQTPSYCEKDGNLLIEPIKTHHPHKIVKHSGGSIILWGFLQGSWKYEQSIFYQYSCIVIVKLKPRLKN